MPNFATALKNEITRIARKELRTETDGMKKAISQYRSDIAALKRRLTAAEKLINRLAKGSAIRPAPAKAEETVPTIRFSASGLAAQRRRLELSLTQMAALVGVSSQSINKWEKEKAHPRAGQLPAIAKVRGMSKKDAASSLAALGL